MSSILIECFVCFFVVFNEHLTYEVSLWLDVACQSFLAEKRAED